MILTVSVKSSSALIAIIIAIIMVIQVIIGLSVKNSSLTPKILFWGPGCPLNFETISPEGGSEADRS